MKENENQSTAVNEGILVEKNGLKFILAVEDGVNSFGANGDAPIDSLIYNNDDTPAIQQSPSLSINEKEKGSPKRSRKVSKTQEKFKKLSQLMPQYKIDNRLKESIIHAMKDINCWSESDEEKEDEPKRRKSKPENDESISPLRSRASSFNRVGSYDSNMFNLGSNFSVSRDASFNASMLNSREPSIFLEAISRRNSIFSVNNDINIDNKAMDVDIQVKDKSIEVKSDANINQKTVQFSPQPPRSKSIMNRKSSVQTKRKVVEDTDKKKPDKIEMNVHKRLEEASFINTMNSIEKQVEVLERKLKEDDVPFVKSNESEAANKETLPKQQNAIETDKDKHTPMAPQSPMPSHRRVKSKSITNESKEIKESRVTFEATELSASKKFDSNAKLSTAIELDTSVKSPIKSQDPQPVVESPTNKVRSSFHMETFSSQQNVKQKVPVAKPKQIPTDPKLQALEQMKQEERENVRAMIVDKAVQVLLHLKKEQEDTEQQHIQSFLKEVTTGKKAVVRRMAFGLVDRQMKKMKQAFSKKMDVFFDRRYRHWQKLRIACQIILMHWKRLRIQRYCRLVLSIGHRMREERLKRAEKEYEEYRIRVAKRRLQEIQQLKQNQHDKKLALELIELGEKQQGKTHKKKENRSKVYSQRVEAIVHSTLKDPVNLEQRIKRADDALFSDDEEHRRPDLHPFSTLIYQKIQAVKNHSHLQESQPWQLVINDARNNSNNLQTTKSEGIESSRKDMKTTISQTTTMVKVSRLLQQGAQHNAQQISEPQQEAQNSPKINQKIMRQIQKELNGTFVNKSSAVHKVDHVAAWSRLHEKELRLNVFDQSTAVGENWEQMAKVDTSIQELKQYLYQDNSSEVTPQGEKVDEIQQPTKATNERPSNKHRSAAYKALEKLCGLSEEDIIRRRNEVGTFAAHKSPLHHNTKILFA